MLVVLFRIWDDGCLDNKLVKGKIVVCNSFRVKQAQKAGALGIIGVKKLANDVSSVVPLQASGLTVNDFGVVLLYISSTK